MASPFDVAWSLLKQSLPMESEYGVGAPGPAAPQQPSTIQMTPAEAMESTYAHQEQMRNYHMGRLSYLWNKVQSNQITPEEHREFLQLGGM